MGSDRSPRGGGAGRLTKRPRKPDRLDALAARLKIVAAADHAAAQTLAIEIVAEHRLHRVLEPALALLQEEPPMEARQPLRRRYFDLAEDGLHRDVDCELRAAIVRALRAIDSRADADVAEAGLRTVQPTPPWMIDVAQPLRAESLLLLAQTDPERADYFAAEMLTDPNTAELSGQPALTAIGVLARRGHPLPVWALARRPGIHPDLLAQAFASLRSAPADLQLDALLGHLRQAEADGAAGDATALVAAEAIILNKLAEGYPAAVALAENSPNANLQRYLAMTMERSEVEKLREAAKRLLEH